MRYHKIVTLKNGGECCLRNGDQEDGQSLGGYVGQAYAQTYPEKLKGFVSIDSAPLQRRYMTKGTGPGSGALGGWIG